MAARIFFVILATIFTLAALEHARAEASCIEDKRVASEQAGTTRPAIGVDLVEDSQDALIGYVHSNSPASAAGLLAGDLVVEYAARPIESGCRLAVAVLTSKVGDTISVVVSRAGQQIRSTIKLVGVPNGVITIGPPIGFNTVADAFNSLRLKPGIRVEGRDIATDWILFGEEQPNVVLWHFPPQNHEAFPAVVRRSIQEGPTGQWVVKTSLLCESGAEACDRLAKWIQEWNTKLIQYTDRVRK